MGGALSLTFRSPSASQRAVGADGFAISISAAGSAVTQLSPQHCPSDECGAFSGPDAPFSAVEIA